jgi:hypothetical protein
MSNRWIENILMYFVAATHAFRSVIALFPRARTVTDFFKLLESISELSSQAFRLSPERKSLRISG